MSITSTTRHRLPALAAACLISVALPAVPAIAKEKVKGPKAEATEMKVDYSVSIPSIDATESNVPDDVLTDILSGNVAAHAEELAGLTATSIAVPEITVNVSSAHGDETNEAKLTFTDLTLENVVDGVAQSVSIGGLSLAADDADAEFGEMSAANVSISGILGVYGLVPSTSTELATIYTDFAATGGSLTSDEVSCDIGGVSGAEFKARPLKTSFAEIMALSAQMEKSSDDFDPALMGQFMHMYADILTAFETSEVTFDGLSCNGEDGDGKAMTFSVAGMTMGGMTPGIYPAISMDGLDITVEGDGTMSVDNVTFKPMDLSATIATLEAAPDTVDEAWLDANARALIPAMEGFAFSGFDMDIPDPESESGRIKASVGQFDLSLASYLNGIPSDIDVSAANIQATIPEDSEDESLAQLRALGVTDIDAGFRIAAAWNRETSAIDLKEVSVTGADLASVVLAGTIGNATESLFSLDADTALAAGMSLAVKALDLKVTDAGLSDIVLAVAAADQGADPASLRPVFAGLAQGTVISMMAGAADAAKLGEAVNSFVSGKAKTLMIGLTAKEDPGLGMADFMAAEQNPATLLPKVNITAEAK